MLTGTDTVASAFSATAHRHGGRPALLGGGGAVTTWATLGASVRLLALGLDADGVGAGCRVRVAPGLDPVGRRAVELAVACLGAVRELGDGADAPPARVVGADPGALRAAGARLDEGDPDRFERRSGEVGAGTPAVTEHGITWTHAQLLWASHSLATSLAAIAEDRVVSTLPDDDVTGWVCGALLPVVSAAATSIDPAGGWSTVAAASPTLLVCRDHDLAGVPDTAGARGPRRRRAGRFPTPGRRTGRPDGLDSCRAAVVVGGGPVATRLAAAGVPTRVAVTWRGHAGLVTGATGPAGPAGDLGRPLPGVTIAVADDGEILVRSESVATGWCEDGWLHTGCRGAIDDAGRLQAVAGPVGRS